MRIGNALGLSVIALVLASCGGGGGELSLPPPPVGYSPTYKVGGSVTDLHGTGLTLQVNQGEKLVIESSGTFTFPSSLANGALYDVQIVTKPRHPLQFCRVTNGFGVLSNSNATNISVSCEDEPLSVGGTISGLRGFGLELQLRAAPSGQPLQDVGTSSPFADIPFSFTLNDLMDYEISIVHQPVSPIQTCVLANGAGTLDSQHVVDLSVTCTTATFSVGGTVTGLRGQGLVLRINDGDSINVAADGSFTFPTPLPDRSAFDINVVTQPTHPRQTCVTPPHMALFGSNANVQITCTSTRILGTSGNDQGRVAVADASGNLYIAGNTTGNLEGSSAGGWDGFFMKLDPNGELLWKRQFGSAGDELVHALEFDSNGDLFIVGSTTGNLDGHTSAGSEDLFLTKYDRNGNKLATVQFGSPGSDVPEGFRISSTGSRYVVGHTTGSLDGVTTPGGADLFVANLDASGTPVWLKQLGTPAADQAFAVDVDAAGHAFVVGSTTGNLAGNTNLSGGEAGFILEYDELGNLLSSTLGCQVNCIFSATPGAHLQSRFNTVAYVIGGGVVVGGWGVNDAPGAFDKKSTIYGRYQSGAFSGYGGTSWSNGELAINRIVSGRADGMLYATGTIDAPATAGKTRAFISQISATDLAPRYTVETDSPGNEMGLAVTSDFLSNAWMVGTATAGLDGIAGLGGEDVFVTSYNINGGIQ